MAMTTSPLRDLLRPEHGRDNLQGWRWNVRRQLTPLRDELVHERLSRREAWLSARAARAVQERDQLLARLNHLASQVLVTSDVDALAADLSRLVADIDRHAQRVRDLAYDDVELEIGGSE